MATKNRTSRKRKRLENPPKGDAGEKGPESEKEPPKRWYTKPLVWVGTIIGGGIGAVVTALVLGLGQAAVDPDALRDGTQKAIRGDDDLDVYVEGFFAEDEGRSIAFAHDFQPDAALSKSLVKMNAAVSDEVDARLLKLGGVRVGTLTLRIGLQSNRNQKIQIKGITPEIISRSAPLDGTLFAMGTQAGGQPVSRMVINLHERVPVAREVVKGDPFSDGTEGRPYFEENEIPLSYGRHETVIIRVNADRFYTVFNLRVKYLINNRQEEQIITDQGNQPFKLTGLHCGPGTGLMSYGRAFVVDGWYAFHPDAHPDQVRDSDCH
ncbi:hypothetical protein [Nonomuraea aurantiaca]|uniref:hypothetical protein n=1 Tax=Nonomuraea aurantiaca TaxID=2878562 RepID=UPI001CD9CCFD|nr:hypothetical protein [Nonomuraea aurantiaca]MCA2229613.1 hypothetical protein [Nonomuraea aurantiaca]